MKSPENTFNEKQSRRCFITYFSAIGLSSTLLPGVLWSKSREIQDKTISIETARAAAEVAGLDFNEEELAMIIGGLNKNLHRYNEIREIHIDNNVPSPIYFNPMVPGGEFKRINGFLTISPQRSITRPSQLEEVAFWPVTWLGHLIETLQVKPSELTEMYLGRLKRYNPILNCVVTLTESRARAQAKIADKEIADGRYRGPLHGIPYGVKDILTAKGYKTTWGSSSFKDQEFDYDATVVERLDEAGAILVAKLATGELAFGDKWFGGRTNNPWDPKQGSSGSSAGSGSATAGGLVGFAIGTDTGGSILSPSNRCGVVGLRPTFGRVSRYGAMTAGFSLDKIGPMCRTAEDCAIVLHAICGPDGKDLAVPRDVPFHWDANVDIQTFKIGYFESAFEENNPRAFGDNREVLSKDEMDNAKNVLKTLRSMGLSLQPVEVPQSQLTFFIEYIERAAAFDEFTRSRQDRNLGYQWHRADLRTFHLTPAVDYLQVNRIRMQLMKEFDRALKGIDVLVSPWLSINALTSMTGHPVASVPNGFTKQGLPTGIAFLGSIYGEDKLLSVAKAYQDKTEFYKKHPVL